MRGMKTKLRGQQGETLVEVLAAVLVATLSVGLLMGGVAVSTRINRQAEDTDESFYAALTAAEGRTVQVDAGAVRVEEASVVHVEIPVRVYGGEGLLSYALDAGGGAGG